MVRALPEWIDAVKSQRALPAGSAPWLAQPSIMTKALLLTLIVACGGSSPATTSNPDDPPLAPSDLPPEEQHFCCEKTWSNGGEYHGKDCDLIGSSSAETCRLGGGKVLYCPGAWRDGEDGVTSCK
jgi:hypothetical protein